MDQPRNHPNHVSLRGASSKEISRDALLQNISQERELRSYAKRAAKAALFIQRVCWRNYTMKMVALQLQEEWEILVNRRPARMTRTWISRCFLRPFLFFITHLSMRDQKIQTKSIECIRICFKILFNSIKSTDLEKNFCCLAMGTIEERKIWIYQMRKIVCLCSSILAQCDSSPEVNQDILSIASLGIRLVLVIIDLKEWKSVANEDLQEADKAVKDLVCFIGSRRSGLYCCLRKYIKKLSIFHSSNWSSVAPPNDQFLVTVSAVTLALRPFHVADVDADNPVSLDLRCAAEQYSVFILTIPWLSLRLPAVLLPALKQKSILSPCFKVLMVWLLEISLP